MANFPESYVEELLKDQRIIRNRLKILAAINNARRFIPDYVVRLQSMKDARATSPESDKLAKNLKKRGFKFLGSTTVCAHMQATGLYNDHLGNCFRFRELSSASK